MGYVITREGIKSDPNKLQGIMETGRLATTTESRVLIGMVQYYRDMWPMQYHILAPLKEEYSGPKGRKILCKYALESYFKELKVMVSD